MAAKKKVELSAISLQQGTNNTYYVTWTFSKTNTQKTKEYRVKWEYRTKKGGLWFKSETSKGYSTTGVKQSTYSPPSNALQIRVNVRPIAKTKKKDGKTVSYYSSAWCDAFEYYTIDGSVYIEAPNTPTVEINNRTFKATVSYTNAVTGIRFEIVEDNSKVYATGAASVKLHTATYSCGVSAGHTYKARAAAYITSKNNKNQTVKDYSDWSDFSSEITPTVPGKISSDLKASATGESQVKLTWGSAVNADHYEIEYTQNKNYFDRSSSEVESESTTGTSTTWYISNLETAKTYYFRVRGIGSDSSNGSWSNKASVTLGTKPNPPTTWAYTYTAVAGEVVTVHWAHNSTDGSAQTSYQLVVKNGNTTVVDDTSSGTTSSANLTTSYADGTVLQWRVRTKGVLNKWSDWSVTRKLTIRTQPTMGISVTSPVTAYPFNPTISAGPASQSAVSFAISVIANESYETTDEYGVSRYITAGEEIFSRFYDSPSSNTLSPSLTPGDIDLESNISYTLTASAAMDSGLNVEASANFTVSFDEEAFVPDAEVTVDFDSLACYIRPFCETAVDDSDDEAEAEPVTNVTLNVYRRQYDGSFIAIATNLDGSGTTTVTDPHPALDLARYRVVAISNATGAMSFSDATGAPFDVGYVVIQWDEDWMEFEHDAVDESSVAPPWTGSMLKLPYNIDITADHSPDVALVEYIGRENPVSYYGTQRGETGRWSVEIPKSDTETLYQIRRLSTYRGDCYVREPSGLGYWANIAVSYSITHNKTTIPVNFTVSRVEGGA